MMEREAYTEINYCIFDPTGNITALVETAVDEAKQPAVAARIMEMHPEVEQVGFVRFAENAGCGDAEAERAGSVDESAGCDAEAARAGSVEASTGCGADVVLRMAGGEFCGNATMCAAALYTIRKEAGRFGDSENGRGDSARDGGDSENCMQGSECAEAGIKAACDAGGADCVRVKASGVEAPIEVRLSRKENRAAEDLEEAQTSLKEKEDGEIAAEVQTAQKGSAFEAAVCMPPALSIEEIREEIKADWISITDTLPIVHMEGIDHIIVEQDSGFYSLINLRDPAEIAIRKLCDMLGSECLGMIFITLPDDDENDESDASCGSWSESAARTDRAEGNEGDASCGSGSESAARINGAEADGARHEKESGANGPAARTDGPYIFEERWLTPLVYVPGADTIFWENSCASGSTAAGMYIAAEAGRAVDVIFEEPAGKLRVKSDPKTGETWLFGAAELIAEDSIKIDMSCI